MYDRIFNQTSAPTGQILQELFASATEGNNGFCGGLCGTSVGTSHYIDHL